jgi:hypothetical protein
VSILYPYPYLKDIEKILPVGREISSVEEEDESSSDES